VIQTGKSPNEKRGACGLTWPESHATIRQKLSRELLGNILGLQTNEYGRRQLLI
jgi:hypothetical protein